MRIQVSSYENMAEDSSDLTEQKMMSYDEFLRRLAGNNECPCCPLLETLPNAVIHQMHKAIQTENLGRIQYLLNNSKDITLQRDFEVIY